jgi:hypothetical protein
MRRESWLRWLRGLRQHCFHDDSAYADKGCRSVGFDASFVHGMQQGIDDLRKGVVFWATDGVGFVPSACGVFQHFDDVGSEIR